MPETRGHNKWTMQVIMNIVKLHVILWKGSNKAAKSKDDLPVIRCHDSSKTVASKAVQTDHAERL